jgi:hypothetical protein
MKLYMCEKPNQAGDLARNLNITGSNDGFIGNDSCFRFLSFSKYSEQSENHRHPNFYIFYHNHRGYIAQLNAQSPK